MAGERYKKLTGFMLVTAFLSYSVFIYTHLPVENPVTTQKANDGKMVWQKYNCNACHQIYGLGGYLGPDLTNEYSVRGDAFIRAFVSSGTNIMPKFNVSDKEMESLSEFLKQVDLSGKSDPRTFSINSNGTIEQKVN